MTASRNKIRGLAGTVIFHALLILAILLMALKTPLPLPEEEGVEVNLGYMDEGTGEIQPDEMLAADMPQPSIQQSEPQEEEQVLTQETEETPVVEQKKDEAMQKAEDNPAIKPEKEQEPEPQPVVNPNALYKGPAKQTAGTTGEGITGKPGDQGKPNGTKDATGYDGSGGTGDAGDGISYSLSGRKAILLPKPDYGSEEQGRVVVTIWVGRSGSVIRAEPGAKGTTVADLTLRNQAKEAALKARFTPSPDAPDQQTGTITYVFIKMN
jgi:TonB family protein